MLIAGLVVLYFGAEAMVKGASQLALALGISPLIVGLTVVAFGTSAPEFLVSFVATWEGSEGISVGNIIGSNICNLTLILGTAAMVYPMAISSGALRREYPIMLVSSVAFYGLAFTSQYIDRWEGGLLFAGILAFVGYNLWLVIKMRRQMKLGAEEGFSEEKAMEELGGEEVEVDEDATSAKGIAKNIAFLVFGFVGLAIGAQLMVDNAVVIAEHFGVPSFIIGTTIVAFGTSLPELATSVVAAMRKESDISVGNIFGSNIFNVMFIMGSVPMIFGMEVESRAPIIDFPVMIAITLLVFPMMRSNYRLGRVEGGILLAIYLAYTAALIIWPNAGAAAA